MSRLVFSVLLSMEGETAVCLVQCQAVIGQSGIMTLLSDEKSVHKFLESG